MKNYHLISCLNSSFANTGLSIKITSFHVLYQLPNSSFSLIPSLSYKTGSLQERVLKTHVLAFSLAREIKPARARLHVSSARALTISRFFCRRAKWAWRGRIQADFPSFAQTGTT